MSSDIHSLPPFIRIQVIGPNSTPYHKPCLTCITCNKRLDSTLLVEHDGEALCKNCHRSHLGVGKGAFGKAVPVRATLPTSPQRGAETNKRLAPEHGEEDIDDDTMRSLSGISISARSKPVAVPPPSQERDVATSPDVARPPNPTPSTAMDPVRPPIASPPSGSLGNGSSITSIDDAVAGGMALPDITSRSAALRDAVGGIERAVGSEEPRGAAASVEQRSARPESIGGAAAAAASAPLPPSSSTSAATPRRLPSPVRRTPAASSNGYKTSSNLGGTESPSSNYSPSASTPFRSQYSISSPNSTPTRLATSINSGTPLCSRCSRPAYHAEAVVGATSGGRVWHRACLKCESCGTTLRKGLVEEGPERVGQEVGEGMNTFCRNCHKMRFGPRGIGSAGSSYPLKG